VNRSDIISYSGFALLIAGVILSNAAVSKIAKRVKIHWEVGGRSFQADQRSREVIRKYRETEASGPLYRNLKIAYLVCGIGVAMFIGGYFLK
jgi:hypothetical protein